MIVKKTQKIVVFSISEIQTVTLAKMEINSIELEKCIEIYMVLFPVMVPFIKQSVLTWILFQRVNGLTV